MRKKMTAIVLLSISSMFYTGCGEKGITQEEYDSVVAERDQYKAELDQIIQEQEEAEKQAELEKEENESKEYGIGDTWEVEGKFKITVNSVKETDYRNQFDESNPAAVYVINYTYENLGLQELYVTFEESIVDSTGKMATSYPGESEKYAQSVPKGAHCEAESTIAVENPGSFIEYVEVYDDEFNQYKATFNLEVKEK